MDKEERELQIKLAEEERKLQVKIAKLNARLQIIITTVFGSIALSAAFIVAGYQLGLDLTLTLLVRSIVSNAFFVFGGIIAVVASWYVRKLMLCEKEFDKLK